MHRPVKPPLCKGRWHGVSRDGGIGARMGVLDCARKATIPQSALRLTAPFTQGGLFLYDRKLAPTRGGPMQASAPTEWVVEKNLAPEGSNGEGSKSVKKNAALLHFLAFGPFDHLIGVLRGERLAAHNERRQFAAQTRSCGYSPHWGEHCSLPGFAALNRGPLLATPQPLSRGSLPRNSETFFASFFGHKKGRPPGRSRLTKGPAAR